MEDDIELDKWFDAYVRDIQRKTGARQQMGLSSAMDSIPEFTG